MDPASTDLRSVQKHVEVLPSKSLALKTEKNASFQCHFLFWGMLGEVGNLGLGNHRISISRFLVFADHHGGGHPDHRMPLPGLHGWRPVADLLGSSSSSFCQTIILLISSRDKRSSGRHQMFNITRIMRQPVDVANLWAVKMWR